MSGHINGDLSERAVADTAAMPWTASPSGSVWRKRVHLVGPPESGQVTSLVRYEPGSTFPEHGHPEGEEILVLEGVFSDEHGDWPAGTYLLNPEGFLHAPFSRDGCLLFVKLRQYPGRDREHVALDTKTLGWKAGGIPGMSFKLLYRQAGFADETRLERWDAQTDLGRVDYTNGAELVVLDGEFSDDRGTYTEGFWLRFPPASGHRPRTGNGCTLYIKRSGFPYLRSG